MVISLSATEDNFYVSMSTSAWQNFLPTYSMTCYASQGREDEVLSHKLKYIPVFSLTSFAF